MFRFLVLLPCTLVVAAVIGGAVTLQARGAQTVAINCGMLVMTSITASNDLACTGDALEVGAANITINLGGHTIDGDDGVGDYGVRNNGFDNVKIKNGRITDFYEGVKLVGDADHNEITGLEIRSSAGDGIDFSTTSDQATVSNNRLVENATGIDVSATGHTITGNRVVANVGSGISVSAQASTFTNNVVTLNGGNGLFLGNSSGNTFTGNIVSRNATDGIVLGGPSAHHNTLSENRVAGNGDDGVDVMGQANTIQNNAVSGNGDRGIVLSTADAGSTLVKENRVIGNGTFGISIDATSNANTLDANVLLGNGNDGVDVNTAVATNLIKNNTADGNGDRGIEAANAIDGGGNKAAGNRNTQQCQVVSCPSFQTSGSGTTPIACGTVVMKSIKAANDLNNCAGDGLVVGAGSITIDLNGHTIDGNDAGFDDGIKNTGGFDKVKVKNGRITDFNLGVELSGDADKNQLIGLEIRSNTASGILVAGASDAATLTNNSVVNNAIYGIATTVSSGDTLQGNRVVGNAWTGIRSFDTAGTLTANILTLNGQEGMELPAGATGNKVEQNIAARNTLNGILVQATGNTLTGNRSVANVEAGIKLNTVSGVGVQANALAANGTQGLLVVNSDSNALKQNELLGNVADGVFVDGNSELNVLDGNTVPGNGADGIDVNDGDGGTAIKTNVADGNADRGIQAMSGIDGGGNKAAGNVNPQQCQVVVCS